MKQSLTKSQTLKVYSICERDGGEVKRAYVTENIQFIPRTVLMQIPFFSNRTWDTPEELLFIHKSPLGSLELIENLFVVKLP